MLKLMIVIATLASMGSMAVAEVKPPCPFRSQVVASNNHGAYTPAMAASSSDTSNTNGNGPIHR